MGTAEAEVRALHRALLDAWNSCDAEAYARLFAIDANMIGFDGSCVDGRDEIRSHLADIFGSHQTAAYVAKVREVRLLSPDVALLRAVAGMVPPDGDDLNPEVNAVQSLVATRDDGEWRVVLFQNTPAAFHGRPELAEQLTDELRGVLRASARSSR
jgi:uncharacterized protein (TIGR02246 family)